MQTEESDRNLTVNNAFQMTKTVSNFGNIAVSLIGYDMYVKFERKYGNMHDHIMMAVYNHWIKNDVDASWEKLAAVLKKCEQTRLANNISRDYVKAGDDVLLESTPSLTEKAGNRSEVLFQFPCPGRKNYYILKEKLPTYKSYDRTDDYGVKLTLEDPINLDPVAAELQFTTREHSYDINQDFNLASPVLWIILQGSFEGQLHVDLQHCATKENCGSVVALKCTETYPRYKFDEVPGDPIFPTIKASLNTVRSRADCHVHMSAYTLALPSPMQMKYRCMVYSQQHAWSLKFTAIFIKDLTSYKKKVLEICSDNRHKILQNFSLEFAAASTEVSVTNSLSVAGWTVKVHPNKVMKADIEWMNFTANMEDFPRIVIEYRRTSTFSPYFRGITENDFPCPDFEDLIKNHRQVEISGDDKMHEHVEGQYMYGCTVFPRDYNNCDAIFEASNAIAGGEKFNFSSVEQALTLGLPLTINEEWIIVEKAKMEERISAEDIKSSLPGHHCKISITCQRIGGSNPLNADVLINGVKKLSGQEAYFNITYDPSINTILILLQSLLNDYIERLENNSYKFPQIWRTNCYKAVDTAVSKDAEFRKIFFLFHKCLWMFSRKEILESSEKVIHQHSGIQMLLYLLYDSVFNLHSLHKSHQLIEKGCSPDDEVLQLGRGIFYQEKKHHEKQRRKLKDMYSSEYLCLKTSKKFKKKISKLSEKLEQQYSSSDFQNLMDATFKKTKISIDEVKDQITSKLIEKQEFVLKSLDTYLKACKSKQKKDVVSISKLSHETKTKSNNKGNLKEPFEYVTPETDDQKENADTSSRSPTASKSAVKKEDSGILSSPEHHDTEVSFSSRKTCQANSSVASKGIAKSSSNHPKQLKKDCTVFSTAFKKQRRHSFTSFSLLKRSMNRKTLMQHISYEEFCIAQHYMIKVHYDPSKDEVIAYEKIAMQSMLSLTLQLQATLTSSGKL